MKPTLRFLRQALLAMSGAVLLAGAVPLPARAQEAVIRKNLPERLPNLPKIDEVAKTAVPGIWEVRIGTDLFYTDEQASYLFTGELIDTRTRANLTRERIDKITAFSFAKLPVKDAIVIKQGTGARKIAVFADPNCGYCKRFERDVAAVKNVTVYIFLYPILGPDSTTKSRDIWCARDPAKTWRDWMIGGAVPPSTAGAKCDAAALDRNTELGRKHRVQGTPATVFEDGSRSPGALPTEEIEKRLTAAAGKG
jgi:thiol:disulfide interchange protein DsbC